EAKKVLQAAIRSMDETDDGWVNLSALGTQLANLSSDFDPRNYGFKKLSDMTRGTAGFEVEKIPSGQLRVRTAKRNKPAKKRSAAQKQA
ncbi:MAG: OST-HTH/LOTUS domain-containing protein, partial [Anderseniella sp.]|nr:OST-HTH/LOTUS domain-containing protein [Anderseniella sp.]